MKRYNAENSKNIYKHRLQVFKMQVTTIIDCLETFNPCFGRVQACFSVFVGLKPFFIASCLVVNWTHSPGQAVPFQYLANRRGVNQTWKTWSGFISAFGDLSLSIGHVACSMAPACTNTLQETISEVPASQGWLCSLPLTGWYRLIISKQVLGFGKTVRSHERPNKPDSIAGFVAAIGVYWIYKFICMYM